MTGYIINNFDKESFTEKIVELLENLNLRNELGQNAYQLAMEEYNPEKNTEDFEALYLDLIKQHC